MQFDMTTGTHAWPNQSEISRDRSQRQASGRGRAQHQASGVAERDGAPTADRQRDAEVKRLRGKWARPGAQKDRFYDEDDFASPEELASALRPGSPPPPGKAGSPADVVAQMQSRMKREHRERLEDISGDKTAAAMVEIHQDDSMTQKPLKDERKRKGLAMWKYISRHKAPLVLKGTLKWKFFGKPKVHAKRPKHVPDGAEALKAYDHDKRKKYRKLGGNLTYHEAKQEWIKWAYRNKTRMGRIKVMQADSPRREDVMHKFSTTYKRPPPKEAFE